MHKVILHPTVLLSVIDHYERVQDPEKDDQRVIGVLLGSKTRGVVDVINCYGIPFEESEEGVVFLDSQFVENMYSLFKKVSSHERIVGWYSTGTSLSNSDIQIQKIFKQFSTNPVYVLIQTGGSHDFPAKAYCSTITSSADGREVVETMSPIACERGELEAEMIGVEYLLRDIKGHQEETVSSNIANKRRATDALREQIAQVLSFLEVADITKPSVRRVLLLLQDVITTKPSAKDQRVAEALAVVTQEIAAASLTAATGSLLTIVHDVIDNRVMLRKQKEEKEKEVLEELKEKARKAEK
ncbi:hypothetical protein PCE1_001431 [Barthelona sp. PCE]